MRSTAAVNSTNRGAIRYVPPHVAAAHPRASRAIRRFNLTHLNRGRNAYQASHCDSLADTMLVY